MRYRCAHCKGRYEAPDGARVERYYTAGRGAPAENVVKVDGAIVHECRHGKQVES